MDSQLPTARVVAVFLALILLLCPFVSFAGVVDVDIFGLSYHFHKKGAVPDAKLKLDKQGFAVFNPGVGLGYDFRKDRHTEGLSPIVHGGMFLTCATHPFTFVAAGGRYRQFFSKNKKWFWETNFMAGATLNNESDDKKYRTSFMPYANVGIGRDMGKYLLTYSIAYVPKGANDISDSTDMLFMNISVSF